MCNKYFPFSHEDEKTSEKKNERMCCDGVEPIAFIKICVSNIFNAHFSYPHFLARYTQTHTTTPATLCEYLGFSCWLRFAVLFQFYFDFIRDRNRKDQRSSFYSGALEKKFKSKLRNRVQSKARKFF